MQLLPRALVATAKDNFTHYLQDLRKPSLDIVAGSGTCVEVFRVVPRCLCYRAWVF